MRRAIAKHFSRYARFPSTVRRLFADQRGVAGMITALSAPVLIAFAALAIDASMWQVNQKQLQGAADQAAIGGINAYLLTGQTDPAANTTVARAGALGVAAGFGYSACPTAPDDGGPCTSGYGASAGQVVNPTSATCQADPTQCLQVTITQQQSRFLSSIVYSGSPVASARAVATVNPGGGGNCVMALNTNPTQPPPPSLLLNGNPDVEMKNCSLMNNLNDPNSIQETNLTGSGASITASGGAQIKLAQSTSFSGQGTIDPNPMYTVSPAPDPYATRTPPSTAGGCTYPGSSNLIPSIPPFDNTQTVTSSTHFPLPTTAQTVGGTTYNVVFTPTSPTTPVVFCGGLKITSGTVYLNPGIYIMDGGYGLDFQGNGALYGHNVTIYVTCDSQYTNLTKDPITGSNIAPAPSCIPNKYPKITIGGTYPTPKVDLTPPCDGNTNAPCSDSLSSTPPSGVDGIAIWMDRDAPRSGSAGCSGTCGTSTITGDANMSIDGLIYEPSQSVKYAGGSTATGRCNALVSNTIEFSGTGVSPVKATFDQTGCDHTSGVAYFGPPRLIE